MNSAPPPGQPITSQIQHLTPQELAVMQGNVQTMYESTTRAMAERDRIARVTDAGRWTPGTSQPK